MNITKKAFEIIENTAKKIPAVKRLIEKEYDKLLAEIEQSAKPYKDSPVYATIPEQGISKDEILRIMIEFYQKEEAKWKNGFVSGAVYHGDNEHIDFLNKVFALNSQSNPLHSDIWPSSAKYEAEIVAMTAQMMHANAVNKPDKVCGTVSSGGTESIMLAMKTYRDWARKEKGIKNILNLATEQQLQKNDFSQRRLPFLDQTIQSPESLHQGVQYIEAYKNDGVYVHCTLGLSRSVLLISAWLLFKGDTLQEVQEQIEKLRPHYVKSLYMQITLEVYQEYLETR
ncbi:MAG: dual specificity protein phosphatase family protein [Bacteroidales bacterium]|nr:dual specificity protein phosphatase family protein [Bacteroidales bacterium]